MRATTPTRPPSGYLNEYRFKPGSGIPGKWVKVPFWIEESAMPDELPKSMPPTKPTQGTTKPPTDHDCGKPDSKAGE